MGEILDDAVAAGTTAAAIGGGISLATCGAPRVRLPVRSVGSAVVKAARKFWRDQSGALRLPFAGIGRVVKNALEDHEYAFALKIVAFRGGVFVGNKLKGAPGIEGFLGNVPVSLKQIQGRLGSVLSNASKAERQARNAGYTGVELFIEAPNVSSSSLTDFASNGGLTQIPDQGTISSITVFTGDGVVRIVGGTRTIGGGL